MAGSLSQGLQGIWMHTQTVGGALVNMADQLVFKFMDAGVKLLENWVLSQLGMTTATAAATTARTGIHAAGAATQTGITAATTTAAVAAEGIKTAAKIAGAATQTTVGAAAGMAEIGTRAATSAAGAFSSTVVIPFIGPVAAPVAAAAALAAVLGFGALISAEGGMGEVPGNQLAMVHKKEMILPAWIAQPMRDSLRAGNSSGILGAASAAGTSARTTNNGDQYAFNYQPNHTNQNADLASLLRSDGATLRKWVKNEMRNGSLKFGKS